MITDHTCELIARIMAGMTVDELKGICAERHRGAWHVAAALAIRYRDMDTLAGAIKAAVGGAAEGVASVEQEWGAAC